MSGSLIYFGGVITGVALVYFHQKGCEKAVSQCKRRYKSMNNKLKADNERLERTCTYYETSRVMNESYKRGYEEGRRDPMSEAERFALAFQGKNAFFRGPDYTVK